MRAAFSVRRNDSYEGWVVDYAQPGRSSTQLVGVYTSQRAAMAWIVERSNQFLEAERRQRELVLIRNNVNVSGTGDRTIVFAHGFGCDQSMWRFVAPEFEKDFRVVLFDHVGSGSSSRTAYSSNKYSSLSGYADDLIEVGNALDLSDAVLVGHSVSAMISVLASITAPSMFQHLVLVGPSARYIDDIGYIGGFTQKQVAELLEFLEHNFLEWSAAMSPIIMGNINRPELSKELNASLCRMDREVAKEFARATFLADNRADLHSVEAATLILQCDADPIAPVEAGAYVHRTIPASKLVQLKATGHCPHLSAPEEVIAAIREFV
jgi:sigma-B regulation protein RsbQ